MCNQAVSLVGAECERRGIATVAIQLLREAAVAVQPPRALLVPFPHGYPLGEPNRPARQRAVVEAALSLLEQAAPPPPVLVEYRESAEIWREEAVKGE
ncbi:MAG: hypothetical protein IPJ17_09880 [Holophagales bacterium]|nr:MAG: hypothetical protein IPJ17_09880 [Holophagales bacterium]